MRFELPGQFRGPECQALIAVSIRLRKELEPWFGSLGEDPVKKISPILRVGGSLGSFGEDAIENLKVHGKEIECDVVIAGRNWASMNEHEIYLLLRTRVITAAKAMLTSAGFTEIPAFLE